MREAAKNVLLIMSLRRGWGKGRAIKQKRSFFIKKVFFTASLTFALGCVTVFSGINLFVLFV